MIRGSVVATRASDGTVILEPRITLRLAGPDRVFQTVEAVVDTGFTTYLTLTERIIRQLGLVHLGQRPATLASGEVQMFDMYGGLTLWHGQLRAVVVHRTSGRPLVGMSLLSGSRLIVDAREGGDVMIEEILSSDDSP